MSGGVATKCGVHQKSCEVASWSACEVLRAEVCIRSVFEGLVCVCLFTGV